jgi:hypothetical protein
MTATAHGLNAVAGAMSGELRGDSKDIQRVIAHLADVWTHLEGCEYHAFNQCIEYDIRPALVLLNEVKQQIDKAAIRLNEERRKILLPGTAQN